MGGGVPDDAAVDGDAVANGLCDFRHGGEDYLSGLGEFLPVAERGERFERRQAGGGFFVGDGETAAAGEQVFVRDAGLASITI